MSRAHGDAEKVLAAVARVYRIDVDGMLGRSRAARVTWPRQIAAYVLREHGGLGFAQIGEVFERDHSTILHAHALVRRRLLSDPDERRRVDAVLDGTLAPEDALLQAARSIEDSLVRVERVVESLQRTIGEFSIALLAQTRRGAA